MRGGAAAASLASLFVACAGTTPPDAGVRRDGLAPCPPSPNCVSSEASDVDHRVAPLDLAVAPSEAWPAAVRAVSELPRTRIVSAGADALQAECRSALFGFVDDLELRLRAAEGEIAVRSASRTGWYDLGVNRRRVADLRRLLRERGVVR